MQVMIGGLDASHFVPILKEGGLYLIDTFRVIKLKNNFNVLFGELMIVFSRITEVKEIHEDKIVYPSHHFLFGDYGALHDKIYQKKVLTDVIEVLTTMTPITNVYLNNKNTLVQEHTCPRTHLNNIYIQDSKQEK
ncbi:Uncharacterized protein TCM_036023 [Theobroma cacao]|uniref:Uncharacterized protein n=1 Tax=Theobroma cacao TaxID=3641 RepID=A0A061FIM4_THECC|nr:Uncharacterized protein TCM_036023 [Theobroma cacao]